MCYKCLYGLLFLVLLIFLYVFVSPEDWVSWITALSTVCMAFFAWKALDTWRKELKFQKKLEIYENLLSLAKDAQKFLEHIVEVRNDRNFCKEKLEKFSGNFELFSQRMLFIGNKDLSTLVADLAINMQPYKNFHKQNQDGSYTAWYENFIDNYLLNRDKFKENLDSDINSIINICIQELQKFYK